MTLWRWFGYSKVLRNDEPGVDGERMGGPRQEL